MRFICLFFPALIATLEEVGEKDDNLKKLIVFAKYSIYINLIMLIFLVFIGRADIHFDDLLTVKFFIVYLIVGMVCAKVLPKLLSFCKENFNLKIRRVK